MRLILTEYISSLKEDGELDLLLQDILKAHGITIFSKPERGRQYGVDIYAVGKDFEDNNKKKVFLITVKQGDLDRQTWNADQNSVYQSLEEIRTVFISNNLASQHKRLPIKIVVAFNGTLKQSVQQNWRGYEESNPQHEYALWQIGWILEQFEEKLLNEQSFSPKIRSLIRKTIIHLENPDYNFRDYTELLGLVSTQFKATKSKKDKLKLLKELHVIVSIVLKYCADSDNLLHAIKATEKYILMLWSELIPGDPDKDFTLSFAASYNTLVMTYMRYYHKISYIAKIKDGFSRNTHDSLTYTYTVYDQIGLFSVSGLIMLQMQDLIGSSPQPINIKEQLTEKANEIAEILISTINNNTIFYSPRSDDQHIEICLLFILLYKLDLKEQIIALLIMLNQQMGEGLLFLNIFPVFNNSQREIAELDLDFDKRKDYDYQASNLLTVLLEWSVILQSEKCYSLFRQLKEHLLKDMDILLWFPEKNTEDILYKQYATLESGYTLSNIKVPEKMADFKTIMLKEFANNCQEKDFSFIKQSIWTIGLLASRHYRTYVFPYYWRQFLTH